MNNASAPSPHLPLAADRMSKNQDSLAKNVSDIESTLFSSQLMTVWAEFCLLVCKADDLKRDPKPGTGGLLGKSVTFVGLPPSTSPDSSPVSTLSIVSRVFIKFTKITFYLKPKHVLKSLQLNWNLHLCCLNHFLLLYVEIYSFWSE
jgi:hypothetical protein